MHDTDQPAQSLMARGPLGRSVSRAWTRDQWQALRACQEMESQISSLRRAAEAQYVRADRAGRIASRTARPLAMARAMMAQADALQGRLAALLPAANAQAKAARSTRI